MWICTYIPMKSNFEVDRKEKKHKRNVSEVTFKNMFINMNQ